MKKYDKIKIVMAFLFYNIFLPVNAQKPALPIDSPKVNLPINAKKFKIPFQIKPSFGIPIQSLNKDIFSSGQFNSGKQVGLELTKKLSNKFSISLEGQFAGYDLKKEIQERYGRFIRNDSFSVFNKSNQFNAILNLNYSTLSKNKKNLFEIGIGGGIQQFKQGANVLTVRNPYQPNTSATVYRNEETSYSAPIGQFTLQNTFFVKPCIGITVGIKAQFNFGQTKTSTIYKKLFDSCYGQFAYEQFFNSANQVSTWHSPVTFIPNIGILFNFGGCKPVYSPPKNVLPEDGKVYNKKEAKQPIMFKWTPVLPKPPEIVVYKIKLVQIKPGMSATQALRTARPLFEKQVNNETQLLVTELANSEAFRQAVDQKISSTPVTGGGTIQGPSFIWNVQATGASGRNYGASKPTDIRVQSADITITNFKVSCDSSYGKYRYTLTGENIGDKPFNTTLIEFSSPGNTITSPTFSPSSVNTVINPGTSNAVTFTGGFNFSGSYPAVVNVELKGTQLNNTTLRSGDSEEDSIKACICHDCDNASISWSGVTINPASDPGVFKAAGTMNINGLPAVYGIEIQVQSYSFSANPPACTNGVSSLEQSGVILQPGSTINGVPGILYNETVSGSPGSNNNISKNIKLKSNSPLPASLPINLNFGFPAPIAGLNSACCKITYTLCLKVTVFYDDKNCKSCTFIHCFPAFTN
jgi:hypothetical protein